MPNKKTPFVPGHFTVKQFEQYGIASVEQHNKWAVITLDNNGGARAATIRIKVRIH